LEDASIEVVLKEEMIWATQKAMAALFDVQVPAISKHISHIFNDGELDAAATVSKMETVVQRGFRGGIEEKIEYYNLDMIIAVGYRVNSMKATRFRQWATSILKEFIQKGFVLDDERMKSGGSIFGKDYFRELLERVRSIRASERRIWQQITDIYAECSIDYDRNSQTTHDFYAMIQNKFHYAISGKTAAEIVYEYSNSSKEHMGLTTWKNAPDGRKGLVSHETARKKAEAEYDIFNRNQKLTSDFDKLIQKSKDFPDKQIQRKPPEKHMLYEHLSVSRSGTAGVLAPPYTIHHQCDA